MTVHGSKWFNPIFLALYLRTPTTQDHVLQEKSIPAITTLPRCALMTNSQHLSSNTYTNYSDLQLQFQPCLLSFAFLLRKLMLADMNSLKNMHMPFTFSTLFLKCRKPLRKIEPKLTKVVSCRLAFRIFLDQSLPPTALMAVAPQATRRRTLRVESLVDVV